MVGLALSMLTLLFMSAAGTGTCPQGFGHWYRSGHQVNLHLLKPSCYKFVKSDMSWVQARNNCRKMGADLVTIETAGENEHLVWIIKHQASLQKPEIVNYRYWGYWTGGNDLETEGDWRWVSHNIRLSYKNWARNQPSNYYVGTEHCLQLMKNFDWEWNDLPCHVETVASTFAKLMPNSNNIQKQTSRLMHKSR